MRAIDARLKKIQELEARIRLREGLPHLHGWKWYPWARKFFESRNRFCLLTAANQASKAVVMNELIPVPDGFKKMSEIRVGDMVIGSDGFPAKVTGIPYEGVAECFRVTFSDNTSTVCSIDHEWVCKGPTERFRKTYTSHGRVWDNPKLNKWAVKSLREIIKDGGYDPEATPYRRHVIPICKPIQYSKKDLFDPYYIGLFLGNGSEHTISFNDLDTDVAAHCEKYGNRYKTNRLIVGVLEKTRNVLEVLGVLKISHEKQIPENYLYGSVNQRKALLAGLMDTDGTPGKNGKQNNFCTTSPEMAKQFAVLVEGLGGISQTSKRGSYYYSKTGEKIVCRDHYLIRFWTTFNPFRGKRKASLWKENVRYKHERVIVKIESVGKKPCKCISVDNLSNTFLCTTNFIVTHNSSSQIRKMIHWCTEPSLWPHLWPSLNGRKPQQFWYMYPSGQLADSEYETKWQEFLPRNEFKDHPQYGWRPVKKQQEIKAIVWNSGVILYFKNYTQKNVNLQGSTVHYIASDEEMEESLYNEMKSRLTASRGHFSSVFTATIGQDFWRLAMEPEEGEKENFPDAFKQTVSLYDCLKYEDGTPSHWTTKEIKLIEDTCSTGNEVLKRVHGRFIKDVNGRKFPTFDIKKHVKGKGPIPLDWNIYVAVDLGSGGKGNHPAAIVFIAVNQSLTKARVFKAWRGDDIVTSDGDVFLKFLEMKAEVGRPITAQFYDFGGKDFDIISTRAGEAFTKADKSHEKGEQVVNTIFKFGMLTIDEDDEELRKLAVELSMLPKEGPQKKKKDDLADACRYCCVGIPWDFSKLVLPIEDTGEKNEEEESRQTSKNRWGDLLVVRHQFDDQGGEEDTIEDQFAELNDLLGG